MHDLQLVGFTTDRRGLIFRPRAGARSDVSFVVPVTDELVELVAGIAQERAEAGPDEPEAALDPVDEVAAAEAAKPRSQMSVRDIQARLRAGEPVARIAVEAGVDEDWIERFAPPIRAEQRRIVDRALAHHLQRARSAESAVPLRRAVGMALADKGIAFTVAAFDSAWSAHLLGHDRWVVEFTYRHRGRDRTASWTYDADTDALTTSDRTAAQLGYVAPGAVGTADGEAIDGIIGDPEATNQIGTAAPAPRRAARTSSGGRSSKPSRGRRADAGVRTTATKRPPGGTASPSKRSPAATTSATSKAAGKKATVKKATTRKSAVKKAAARTTPRSKAPATKAADSRKSPRTTSRTKATVKKAAPKKAAVRKAASKKAAVGKAASKKATVARRATATTKRAGAERAAPTKKAAAKVSPTPRASEEAPAMSEPRAPKVPAAVRVPLASEGTVAEQARVGSNGSTSSAPRPRAGGDGVARLPDEPARPASLAPVARPRVVAGRPGEVPIADVPLASRPPASSSRSLDGPPADVDPASARRARAAERSAPTVQFRSGSAAPVRAAGDPTRVQRTPGPQREDTGATNGSANPAARRRRQLRGR